MAKKLIQVAIMPQTKERLDRLAAAHNYKKITIFDWALKDFEKKIQSGIAPGA
ncbi:MAG: hypothetical protein J6W00_15055 [Lentisphaeria bacterium]|nr:hypothetical protein [Lentisphaeria bacterium]